MANFSGKGGMTDVNVLAERQGETKNGQVAYHLEVDQAQNKAEGKPVDTNPNMATTTMKSGDKKQVLYVDKGTDAAIQAAAGDNHVTVEHKTKDDKTMSNEVYAIKADVVPAGSKNVQGVALKPDSLKPSEHDIKDNPNVMNEQRALTSEAREAAKAAKEQAGPAEKAEKDTGRSLPNNAPTAGDSQHAADKGPEMGG